MLTDWHQRAAVRTAPRRLIAPADFTPGGGMCFPEELTPWVHHELVADLGLEVRRRALAQQLFSYLHFTDRLEHEVVNQTVRRIATGVSGIECPAQFRMDAYKIYCDEAYHSLFSADIAMQIQQASGYVFYPGTGHPALEMFERVRDSIAPESRGWFELLFVTVSETLVSSSLERIPKASGVLSAVREMAADHLHDELRHHGFFAKFFRIVWPRIPRSCQIEIGRMLPQFILAFMTPDAPGIRAFLGEHLSPAQIDAVLSESYPLSALRAGARSASTSTRLILKAAGVFEMPEILDAFVEAGLEPVKVAAARSV